MDLLSLGLTHTCTLIAGKTQSWHMVLSGTLTPGKLLPMGGAYKRQRGASGGWRGLWGRDGMGEGRDGARAGPWGKRKSRCGKKQSEGGVEQGGGTTVWTLVAPPLLGNFRCSRKPPKMKKSLATYAFNSIKLFRALFYLSLWSQAYSNVQKYASWQTLIRHNKKGRERRKKKYGREGKGHTGD